MTASISTASCTSGAAGVRALEDVSYDDTGKFIAFRYSTPNRNGRSDYTVRVPVPAGKDEDARRVLAGFQTDNNI